MQFSSLLIIAMLSIARCAPVNQALTNTIEQKRSDATTGDDYVVYPDVDRDEDVVYAYHGINEKRAEAADQDDYVIYPDIDRDEDVVYAYHGINE